MKLSIVVPCYNEQENLPLILECFSNVISRKDIEVVLVNNGSTDNTASVLEELLPQYPFARTVLVEENQGYGYGILTGLQSCDAEFIGWTHADMQTDPKDIIKALEIIENYQKEQGNNRIFVKGKRKGRPLSDVFFTFGMSVFESLYLRQRLNDINGQPNIFPEDFFRTWENAPYDFSLDLYAFYMARKMKLEVKRFHVLFSERIHGNSKWNTGLKSKWEPIKRTMAFSRELKRHSP